MKKGSTESIRRFENHKTKYVTTWGVLSMQFISIGEGRIDLSWYFSTGVSLASVQHALLQRWSSSSSARDLGIL